MNVLDNAIFIQVFCKNWMSSLVFKLFKKLGAAGIFEYMVYQYYVNFDSTTSHV